jgi:hypothetical protein
MSLDWEKSQGGTPPEANPAIGPTTPSAGGDVGLPTIAAPQAPGSPALTGNPNPAIWDSVGQALFGRNNGSPLGGVPLLGDAVGAVGNVISVPGRLVAAPFGLAAEASKRVPLGWLPGGADENFAQIGTWAKDNNPEMYRQWQAVKASSDGDILGGGTMKAAFNTEAYQALDDMTKDGVLGSDPTLAIGRAGVGSLGDGFSHAIQGWLGLMFGVGSEQRLATKFYDPRSDAEIAAGADVPDGTNVTRVDQIRLRMSRGEDLNDVESVVAGHLADGSWTDTHAKNYLISHGQSDSRDPGTQLAASIIYDPLTYLTIGAGSIAKAGAVGAKLAESGIQAETVYQKLATVIADVQGTRLGPAFRFARGMIDPLGVYKPTVADRAILDLRNGVAIKSFDNAYGNGTIDDLRRFARESGKSDEVDSAIASYSIDQANLMIAKDVRASQLREGFGEELMHTGVDDVIEPFAHNASKDALGRLTDEMYRNAKNEFTPAQETSNAYRIAASLGGDPESWAIKFRSMSGDLKSAWNAITYKMAEKDFVQSLAVAEADLRAAGEKVDLPVEQMTLMTDSTLDDFTAQAVLDRVTNETDTLAARTAAWNENIKRYPVLAEIGYAPGGKEQLDALVNELKKGIDAGRFSRRATDEELAQFPAVMSMLDRHTINGERLWNVGFRPSEDVAWGLKRSAANGKVVVDRDPSISHVIDAVPGRMRYSDTIRNVLGQTLGKAPSEALTRPIESMESFIRTSADMVSGQRLVLNMQRRFEKSMVEKVGLPKPIATQLFGAARDAAALDYTTIRGINPTNVFKSIRDAIPLDFRTAEGHVLDVHTVMDHLLQASEGDLRIMGLTSKTTQRMRNIMRASGIDPVNWMGQMTVSMYNKVRYSQPTFLIQRITDGPYFNALYGVTPLGKGALKGTNAALRKIEENMGRTGVARDFAMDMPEYATRANFTDGVRSRFEQQVLDKSRIQKIMDAPDTIIANNMTAALNGRLGQIVHDTLNDVQGIIKDADEVTAARMEAELKGPLARNFADLRAIYSESAGRVVDDNEVGLRYLQEMLTSARRVKIGEDGLDMKGLLHEQTWKTPSSIGEIESIHPDGLAQELGYADADAMRKDLTGTFDKNGIRTPGQHDIAWLEQTALRDGMHAHPDVIRRAAAYFGEDWDSYWHRLSRGVDQGGLDISPHAAKPAQDLIAAMAKQRGMDPWEFLSGVMKTNIGGKDLDTSVGRLMSFLQSGADSQPLEAWTNVFRSQLDPSAQDALLAEFSKATGVATPGLEAAAAEVKPAAFTRDARGNAVLPASFKHEPGYVYRIETPDAARSGWPERTGVSIKPNPIYVRGDEEVVLRAAKADHPDTLAVGRHGPGGGDRLTVGHTPPEHIEMLGEDGAWHPLPPDPYDTMFDSAFPARVRARIASGVPDASPEVEAYIQHFTKWVQTALGPELAERTRGDLKRLLDAVPTTGASPFNRTQALAVGLLKDKIRSAQTDIFRLAEMSTRRSVLERSLNHPLFGIYPASYMWGKVLPETMKFLAKNPYAATYLIADVQRAIATQREYDPDMEAAMSKIDKSSTAFLLDYLTPSLPWSAQDARTSPFVRDLFAKGGPDVGKIWSDELDTVNPMRWFKLFAETGSEAADAVGSALKPKEQAPPNWQGSLSTLAGQEPTGTGAKPPETHGPVQATGLAPVLQDSMAQLEQTLTGR